MARFTINYNDVLLFKKSDFPLLKNIRDFEKDMDVWYQNSEEDFYMVDHMIESAAYRTYLWNKFCKNGRKDVRMFHIEALFDSLNRGTIDINISDFYVFKGVEYQC